MSDKFKIEIEGDIGELDYGGITLNVMDKLVKAAAEDIVLPEVQRRINRITGETEASVKVKRIGFFNPRGTVGPQYGVETDIPHGRVLEYADGGKHSFMRTAARARKVKTGIKELVKRMFGPEMTAQIRNFKRKKK